MNGVAIQNMDALYIQPHPILEKSQILIKVLSTDRRWRAWTCLRNSIRRLAIYSHRLNCMAPILKKGPFFSILEDKAYCSKRLNFTVIKS